MARFVLITALFAVASGFQLAAVPMRPNMAVSREAPVQIAMQEGGSKSTVIGAAAVGGIVGVYLFHELSAGVILASILAYGATQTSGTYGEVSKTAGDAASKVYSKTIELNEQYDVLPKAKSAIDTVTTAASNINSNYGITAKIDEQLKLSEATAKVTSKFDEVKSSVTEKVSDLKTKASSAEE
jgi:hypothetical protein